MTEIEITPPAPVLVEIAQPAFQSIELQPVGLPGPPGPAGQAAAYEHMQASAAPVWTINHNIGRWPLVQVFTTGGVGVLAEVQQFSPNVTLIHFDEPVAGRAVCI
jgi:hypothetical protein